MKLFNSYSSLRHSQVSQDQCEQCAHYFARRAYNPEHQIWALSGRPRPAFAAIIPFMAYFRLLGAAPAPRGWNTSKRAAAKSEPIWVFQVGSSG